MTGVAYETWRGVEESESEPGSFALCGMDGRMNEWINKNPILKFIWSGHDNKMFMYPWMERDDDDNK